MRITNTMMTNNSLRNINNNKLLMDKLDSQYASGKKIQKPSDDPVVAIRSLKLNSDYAEIAQYCDKNIKDALSWMENTDTALEQMNDALKNMINQCESGANGSNSATDRETIVKALTSIRDEIYSSANADYAGRNLFTGFKTDTDFAFKKDDPTAKYDITETFSLKDVDFIKYISGGVDTSNIAEVDSSTIKSNDVYRIRLTYDDLGAIGPNTFSYVDKNGTTKTIPVDTVAVGDAAYTTTTAGKANYIKETGELILSKDAYDAMIADGAKDISISYEKTGFKKGQARPENYFTCTNKTVATNPISYTKETQNIEYTVNFNQKLQVNVEGSDALNKSIQREADEILNAVSDVIAAEEKLAAITKMKSDPANQNEAMQKKLTSMEEAAEKEHTLKEGKLHDVFAKGMTKAQEYSDQLNIQSTDLGSRMQRLAMTQKRVESQKLNLDTLKKENIGIELTEVVILQANAITAYEASLKSASKMLTQSLLDFV